MKLCVITSENAKYKHEDIARFAMEGGADCVQFRKKTGTTKEFLETGDKIRNILEKKATYIVDDRVDIALACGADGVHIGDDDMPIERARELCGKDFIIGVSVRCVEGAIEAERRGASYLGAGPVFKTKNKDAVPIELEELERICKTVKIPVIAIGGINLDNVDQVMKAGAHGIAVISAVVDSANPKESVKKLMKKVGPTGFEPATSRL